MITREEAKKFTLDDFGMDPKFPEKGAECSEKHVEYMLQVVWPLIASYRKVLVSQSAMSSYTAMGMFAVGDRDLDYLGAGHVFYIDNPGKGKTLLAKVPGKVVGGGDFARFQGVPDALPADYTGSRIIDIVDGKRVFKLVKGPGFAHIQLLDEFNRTSPRAQAGVLEAIGEGTITIAGETHKVQPFAVVTTNPIESEGTFPLSEAFLDRIMFQIRGVEFTAHDFAEILRRTQNYHSVKLQNVCDIKKVHEIRKFFHETIHISSAVEDQVGRFCETINNPKRFNCLVDLQEQWEDAIVQTSISGRGIIHLMGAARVLAAFRYRDYVTPDDVFKVLLPILRHRVIFSRGVLRNFRGEWQQQSELDTRDRIITQLITEGWR